MYKRQEQAVPRPEQWAYQNSDALPQVFPEGSPAHPSRDSMHYRAAQIIAYFLTMVFDPYHEIDDSLGGQSLVYRELQLMADNIAYARCTAGVNWRTDNDSEKSCALLAENMFEEIYGYKSYIIPEMRALSFA